MDRENDNVGCLEIEIFPINNPLDLSCFPLTEEAEISCFTLTEPLQLSCFEICSVNKDSYLRVHPDYVWLTPDMLASGEFEIISNVDWIIN